MERCTGAGYLTSCGAVSSAPGQEGGFFVSLFDSQWISGYGVSLLLVAVADAGTKACPPASRICICIGISICILPIFGLTRT